MISKYFLLPCVHLQWEFWHSSFIVGWLFGLLDQGGYVKEVILNNFWVYILWDYAFKIWRTSWNLATMLWDSLAAMGRSAHGEGPRVPANSSDWALGQSQHDRQPWEWGHFGISGYSSTPVNAREAGELHRGALPTSLTQNHEKTKSCCVFHKNG